MVASRERRRQEKVAAHKAQIDLERLAAQQEQEKRRVQELAAKRQGRKQNER